MWLLQHSGFSSQTWKKVQSTKNKPDRKQAESPLSFTNMARNKLNFTALWVWYKSLIFTILY